MYDKTRKGRIRNENICEKVGVVTNGDKLRENSIRWFLHIQ